MRAKKELAFWCCPATASNLHPKEWSHCTAHLPGQRITGQCEGRLGEAHPLPLWIQECLEEVANTYLGSLQCLPQRSAKHRKAAERGCWFWSGWQRTSRERWRRAKLCHGVMLGQEWDQHCERGPQPCLPLWESLVWERRAAQESKAEVQTGLIHGPLEFNIHLNRPWHKWRSLCHGCKLCETRPPFYLAFLQSPSLQQPGQ